MGIHPGPPVREDGSVIRPQIEEKRHSIVARPNGRINPVALPFREKVLNQARLCGPILGLELYDAGTPKGSRSKHDNDKGKNNSLLHHRHFLQSAAPGFADSATVPPS